MSQKTINGTFKGLNTSKHWSKVPVDYLSNANNMFVKNGEIRSRKSLFGYTSSAKVLNRATNRKATDSGHYYHTLIEKNTSGVYRFLYWTSEIASGSAGTVTDTQIGTSFGTAIPFFKYFNNALYNTDGYKFLFEVGSSLFTPISLPKVTGVTTDAPTGADGVFTVAGQYRWIVSFVYDDIDHYSESEPSNFLAASTETVSTLTNHVVVNIPAVTSGYTVTHYRIYRLDPDKGEAYLVTTQVHPGTSTTYTDTGTAVDLTQPAPLDNEIAPFSKSDPALDIAVYRERMFAILSDNESLVWSNIGDANNWPAVNTALVGDSGDPFIRLIVFPTFLLIVKKFSMWSLEGDAVANFRITKVANYGSEAPMGTVFHDGYLYFINSQGIWRTDTPGGVPEQLSSQIQTDWETIFSTKQYLENYSIGYEPYFNQLWIGVDYTDGDDNLDTIYIYDLATNNFSGKCTTVNAFALGTIHFPGDTTYLIMSEKRSSTWYTSIYNMPSYMRGNDWGSGAYTSMSFALSSLMDQEQPEVVYLLRMGYVRYYFEADLGNTLVVIQGENEPIGGNYSIVSSYDPGNGEQKLNFNIGRSDNAIRISFSITTAAEKEVIIRGVKLEYEIASIW